ncbi:MAG: hypothetical protein WCK03_04150 [Candidatus Taylorbacteria bacterium]
MSVLDILVQKNLIGKDDAREIRAAVAGGTNIDDALIAKGVNIDDVIAARGEFMGMPVRSLVNTVVPFEALDYIPEEAAMHYNIVPIGLSGGVLEVGMVDPDNMEARDAVTFLVAKKNIPYKMFLISVVDFKKVVELYKGLTGEVTKALTELETELSIEPGDVIKKERTQSKSGISDETVIIEDAPVVKIVATIVRYAVEGEASCQDS